MAEISRELDQRIYGDVYERLVSLSATADGMPPDVARMIELRQAILAAEEAVTAADRALPFPDIAAKAAAENQRTAAEDSFVQHVEQMHAAGTLEAALTYVETTTPERPEVIAARAEAERLAREAEERAAADAARFVPQAEETARPRIYMNAEFALAGLLMEVHRDLPADAAAFADNPIIQQLITARAQGEDAYRTAAETIVQQHFESGELDRSLYALQDQMRSNSFAPTAAAEGYQRHLLMNTYLERLAGIPADAADVPPAMTNLVTLARELHAMRTAPEGTHTPESIDSKTFDYLQEGTRLLRQQVPIGTFLQERYPNVIEGVGNYLSALPEVAWNNPGVLLQSAENFVGSTVGLVGDVADLGDALVGGVLNNRFFQLGSPKEWFGAGDVRLGEVVSGAVVGGLDFLTGRPELRANSNDAMVMSGTENALDGIAIMASLGTAGLAKAGVKTAVRVGLHETDDAARIALRAADDVPVATATAVTNTTLPNITASLGTVIPRATEIAQESYMGLKNLFVRFLTRQVDEAAPVVARTVDDVAPVVTRNADDVARVAAAAETIPAARIVTGLTSAFSSAASGLKNFLMGSPTRLGIFTAAAAPTVVGLGISAYESNSGGAASQMLIETAIDSARALVNSGVLTRENIGSAIRNMDEIADIMNPLDTTSVNSAAYMALRGHADPHSPAAITDAKNAALGALLLPMNAQSLAISHFIRAQVIDQVITDPQEANRVLAEEFIQDVLTKSRANALGENQITREDLKSHLATIMANPSHPLARTLNETRLADGLRQIWPDLAPQPAATRPAATETRPAAQPLDLVTRMQNGLQDISTQLGNIPGLGWLAPVFAAIAAIIGAVRDMFNGPNTTAQTDNPNRLRALATNLGETPILPRVTHDGTPADPVTTTPEERRVVTPGVTPGLTAAAP